MIALIISILLSLNVISSPAEYEQMTPEQQEQASIIIEDVYL
ncbi:MAG: hypothetical protein AB8H12_07340 [Lewinella sp.]